MEEGECMRVVVDISEKDDLGWVASPMALPTSDEMRAPLVICLHRQKQRWWRTVTGVG
jgi:hypothetical protein